uniref:KIND domain-containing protein n=1 Tax=Denticeps clupeoides TaxID=299321 RepID=A0AAY4CRS7_9TELE
MGTFVTLAEVLEAKEAPLGEDEVWAILLGAVEALMDYFCSPGPGSLCSTVTPGSVLLSTAGNIAFKSCGRSEDVSSFTPPEMVQADNPTPSPSKEKMVVFSLGMTLYWTVDYRIPQNQPVQLSDRLNSLLLSMCEDMVNWRPDLQSVLEACERHHRNALLPHPEKVIRQLTEDVLQEPVGPYLSLFLSFLSHVWNLPKTIWLNGKHLHFLFWSRLHVLVSLLLLRWTKCLATLHLSRTAVKWLGINSGVRNFR